MSLPVMEAKCVAVQGVRGLDADSRSVMDTKDTDADRRKRCAAMETFGRRATSRNFRGRADEIARRVHSRRWTCPGGMPTNQHGHGASWWLAGADGATKMLGATCPRVRVVVVRVRRSRVGCTNMLLALGGFGI